MPRHRRLEIPSAVYHVIARGLERRAIFKDNADREEFLRRLAESLNSNGSKCYGWVLMPNHFHLLIRTGANPLSTLMRKVLTGYAIYFNRKYKRHGYLYQNRYKSVLCHEETYLLELVRYIHLNPLRAGIVKDMDALNKFPWSGHAVILGTHRAPFQTTGEILERFGTGTVAARNKYLAFISDGMKMGKRDDLSGGGLRRSAGGWQGVHALKRAKEYWRGDERVLGDGEFVNHVLKISDEKMARKEQFKKDGWDIKRLVKRVCEVMGVREEEIIKRGHNNTISAARALVAYWGYRELGISGTEIANYFCITRPSVSTAIKRGEYIAKQKGVYLIN